MKPTPARLRPEAWYCDSCRLTFVLILECDKLLECAAPHADDHCHVGDRLLLPDGSTQAAVYAATCLPYSTTE